MGFCETMRYSAAVIVIGIAITAQSLGAQQCMPAIQDTAWTLFKETPVGTNTGHSTPNWPSINARGLTQSFEGRFRLTIVQTSPHLADSAREGVLELRSRGRSADSTAALYGTSNIDFQNWGTPGAAYSAASTDPDRPGVLLEFDKQRRVLLTVGGAGMEDAGVLLAVFRVSRLHRNVGEWRGRTSPAERLLLCGPLMRRRVAGSLTSA
jgi:hypothetical protein